MAKTATLIICDCDERMLDSIKKCTYEKMSRLEKAAVEFCQYSADRNDIASALTSLFHKAAALEIGAKNLNVVMLYGRGVSAVSHVQTTADILSDITRAFALWRVKTYLVLLLNEFPMARENYREIISRIPYRPSVPDGTTDYSGIKNPYYSVYVLTDKNSEQQPSGNERIDAAAMLTYLIADEQMPEGGIYSAGIGKLSTSAREISEYATHIAVEALKNGRIDHKMLPDIGKLCVECMGEGNGSAVEKINEQLNRCIRNTFAYIEGEEDQICTESKADVINFADEMILNWKQKLMSRICSNPFCEEACRFFDIKSDEFNDFIVKLEADLHIGETENEIAIGLLTQGKKIIKPYNSYINARRNKKKELIKAVCNKFRACRNEIYEFAVECRKKRDNLCVNLEMDPVAVENCKQTHSIMTQEIEDRLWSDAVFMPEDCHEDLLESESAWNELIEKMLSRSGAVNIADAIVTKTAARPDGEIVASVLPQVNAKAMLCLAGLRDVTYGTAVRKFDFMPAAFRVSSIQQLIDRHVGSQETVIPVQNQAYHNIEELAIFRIDADRETFAAAAEKLTVFSSFDFDLNYTHVDTENKEPEWIPNRRAETYITAEVNNCTASEQPESNGWNVHVRKENNRFNLYFTWEDKKINQLSCHVKKIGKSQDKYLPIKRNDFLDSLYVDITGLVDNGRHVASLIAGDQVLGTCEFIGNEHVYGFSVNREDFPLNKERQIDKLVIKLRTVDGDVDAGQNKALFYNLDLVLDQSHRIHMPSPVIRHKNVSWTVYTDCRDLSIEPVGDFEDGYKVELLM